MRLAERYEEITVALELFPLCARCGRDLSKLPLRDLLIPAEQPRRFAHVECPSAAEAPYAA